MGSAIRYADARCTLGLSLEECVDNLLAARQLPGKETFPDQQDPVTMPYFGMPLDRPRLEPAEIIYPQIHAMVSKALNGLTPAERKRTGIFLGSSSFDVAVSEHLYRQQLSDCAKLAVPMPIIGYGKLAQGVAHQFDLSPQVYTYSTACTSSANALLYAHRFLQAGAIDHALVLGMEFFNHTTLLGFYGLGLISPGELMMPFSRHRDGLILGEACGLLLLSRAGEAAAIEVCGGAVATDNHSLTAANIDGSSLAAVIQQAMGDSQAAAGDIVAIKAHGTASLMNDEAEAAGLKRIFTQAMPPTFALKPFCGHTLGACGALEMALTIGCLRRGFLPANPQQVPDPALGIELLAQPQSAPDGFYLFNCFAFGGNNNATILRKVAL